MNSRAGGMRAMGPQMGGPQAEAFMRDFGGAAMRPMQMGRAAQGGVGSSPHIHHSQVDEISLFQGDWASEFSRGPGAMSAHPGHFEEIFKQGQMNAPGAWAESFQVGHRMNIDKPDC